MTAALWASVFILWVSFAVACYGWHRAERQRDAALALLSAYRRQLAGSTETLRVADTTIRQLSAALRVQRMTIIPRSPRDRMWVN